MVSGLSNFKITVKPDCMFSQQAGDFMLERKYYIKTTDSDKKITYRKNKVLIINDSSQVY